MINGYVNGPYLHFYCGGGEKVAAEGKGNHGVEGKWEKIQCERNTIRSNGPSTSNGNTTCAQCTS
jgi:hypothetical protein